MKPSKSVNSLAGQQQQQVMSGSSTQRRHQPQAPDPKSKHQTSSNSAPTSPICRCRVMYLGSSVPHITKDGLQGIQEPLRELYPDKASLSQGNAGIDSWLSVWSNGILIENVDETGQEVKRFFKIEALHYCAAVKYVSQVSLMAPNGNATLPHSQPVTGTPKFLPLDSPHARMQPNDDNTNPPIFASILRRTTGVKVLECHAFICKREAAANALVRCCFHAYADTMYAKQIGAEIDTLRPLEAPSIAARRSKSIAALNDFGDNEVTSSDYGDHQSGQTFVGAVSRRKSLNNGQQQTNYDKSSSNNHGDMSDSSASQQQHQIYETNNLQKQAHKFSKSMHQLNQPHLDQGFNNCTQDGGGLNSNLSTSHHNLASGKFHNDQRDSPQEPPPAPLFPHNPYASRVPSYPPQNIIDQQQQQQQLHPINSGTLRSVKSVAANSIASTLLRSKKHAKAMSMAQLNNQQQQAMMNQQQQVISFHQHYPHQSGSLYGGSFVTLPPVPPMFLPNVPRANINGSQTMKLPSRHMLPVGPMTMNFEAMTPKEMKKLLKKSAKYGIDPSKFAENGLPLMPFRPMPMPMPANMQQAMHMPFGPPLPQGPGTKSGTINSQSLFSMDSPLHQQRGQDMPDLANPSMQQYRYGMTLAQNSPMAHPHDHLLDDQGQPQPIKSILVKPNPEFLKSKAGKKWLKQQKEFKKLLPSHLDGLPIVFGPPPMDIMDPASIPNSSASSTASLLPQPPPPFMHPPSHLPPPPPSQACLPMLDSNGFYNPHPLYGPSGRASAASTLVRNSPHIMQQQHQQQQHINEEQMDYLQRNHHHQQSMYSNPILMGQHQQPLPPPPPPMLPPHLQAGGSDDLYGNSHLGPFDRQFQSVDSTRRQRNHMVEQSVISLGDEENDEEEEEEDNGHNGHNQDGGGPSANGYYDQVETGENGHHRHRRRRESSYGEGGGHQQRSNGEHVNSYQDDYEQMAQQIPSDDHNSNSSGIYRRRGHINERAFGYSIRQEASKSSADGSDAEYRNGDLSDSNNNMDYRLRHKQQQHHDMAQYDNPQQSNIYQNRPPIQYYKQQHNPSQHLQQNQHQRPVDELTARLENQLNMKSFANSYVKSHM